MTALYQIASFFLALMLLPVLFCLVAAKKYRFRLVQRCGFGLTDRLSLTPNSSHPSLTVWIHALSVGEVTSALPLVRGLRASLADAQIIFSAATRAGEQTAERLLAPYADAIIAGPLDLGPVIPLYLRSIQPDLFILVETDFWPHWLSCLARKKIPMLLVNGRISQHSFARYQRYGFFFRRMFDSFNLLSMQTAVDAEKMIALGIASDKVRTLGNLKFDTLLGTTPSTAPPSGKENKASLGFSEDAPLWVCGSTHQGEEALLLQAYAQLLHDRPDLQLLLAPRNIERAPEIATLAKEHGLTVRLRSSGSDTAGPLLILDTLGELAGCYGLAEVVFIGGSLVAQGGHNPIEAAAVGVPVLFGPHMEDFSEIAATLIQTGGALQISSVQSLIPALQQLLADHNLHQSMAKAARMCIENRSGVVSRYLQAIDQLLIARRTEV